MSWRWLYGVLLVCYVTHSSLAKPVDENSEMTLRMPDVQPQTPDKYLCQPFKMPDNPLYITGFAPHANMSTAHHMLIYGCTEPGDETDTWNCGEMQASETKGEKLGPVCKSGAEIIYAWAMDAPDLKLPKGVAFKVGGDTEIKWVVLQVHYKNVTPFVAPNDEKDHSGVTMTTTTVPQPKRAGVYLLGTGGVLAPHATVYMETACKISENITIHPFAYRTHAHSHGEVNSGYRVRDGKWTEIGRQTPKKPQMFYPVKDPNLEVHGSDILAARCTMINNDSEPVAVGSTQKDEMCNYYIMYWVDGDEILKENYCFTAGPPTWDWSMFDGIHVENAPLNASLVPGASQILQKTKQLIQDTKEDIDSLQQEFEEWLREVEEQEREKEMGYRAEEYENYLPDESEYSEYLREYPESFERASRGGYPEDTYELLRQLEDYYEGF